MNSRGRLCVHSLRRIFAVTHRAENGLIALAFATSPRRVWGEWLRWRSVYGFTCLATLAMLVTTVAVFPILNAKNSYSPFFDQVRDQLRDRELYTTLLDDRRLPLIEFYLDRHVPIIRDDEKLFQLFKSNAKVNDLKKVSISFRINSLPLLARSNRSFW